MSLNSSRFLLIRSTWVRMGCGSESNAGFNVSWWKLPAVQRCPHLSTPDYTHEMHSSTNTQIQNAAKNKNTKDTTNTNTPRGEKVPPPIFCFFCQHIFTVIKFHDWRFRSYTYHIRYHFSLFLFSLIVHWFLVLHSSFTHFRSYIILHSLKFYPQKISAA